MTVTHEERHRRASPCPICGGFDGQKRGDGKRCSGYTSADGKWTICTQVSEGAHHAVSTAAGESWAHLRRDEPMTRSGIGSTVNVPLALVKPVNLTRELAKVEKQLLAVESRSEAARSADEYEADRDEYDALWAKLEELKTQKKQSEEPEEPREPIAWVGLNDMAKTVPPPEWVCEGLKIAKGPVSCIAGYGYSGKTAIAQALLLCLATGKSLFGLFKTNQMPVGWLDYEQGWRMSAARLQRQARGMGIDLGSYPSNSLRYAEYPDVYLTEKGDGIDKVAKAVDGMGLCLMDSAKALTPGIDENDSRIRIPFDALSRVTMKTGCIFVVIHHFGKGGGDQTKLKPLKERMRGSSALFDAMQTVWGLEAKEKETFTRCELSKDRVTNLKSLEFGVQFIDEPSDDSVTVRHLDPEQMKSPSKAALFKAHALETVKANPALKSIEAIRFHMPEGYRNLNETREAIRELQEAKQVATINGAYRAV